MCTSLTGVKKHKIIQQAYHSRCFVQIHYAKYIKAEVISEICTSMKNKVQSISSNPDTLKEATEVSEKFKKLNNLYYYVHSQISHGYAILPEDIEVITVSIQKYLDYFRKLFPDQIIPKQHFLEDHVVQWISQWNFGMVLHGEQGGKSLYKEFNRLGRVMQGVQNEIDKLLCIMKEHHTLTSPIVQSNIIHPKKRKKANCKLDI